MRKVLLIYCIRMTTMLQIPVNETFLSRLKKISSSQGRSPQDYAKVAILEKVRQEEKEALTGNGFTPKEERRLARSLMIARKERKEGKLKKMTVDAFISQL